jgi:hypothetical protein
LHTHFKVIKVVVVIKELVTPCTAHCACGRLSFGLCVVERPAPPRTRVREVSSRREIQ